MRALLAVALAATSACGAARPIASDRAVLVIRSSAGEASVWIDERYVGVVETLPNGVALPPGAHRVELQLDGHFTRYFDVELSARERRELEVSFVPLLP